MAKQQFTFTLSNAQVRGAILERVANMVDASAYDLAVGLADGITVTVTATKRRARKAKAPKVAAVPKAAA